MKTEHVELVDAIKRLSETLKLSPAVTRLDTKDEPGSWRLAYALVEIRQVVENLQVEIAKLEAPKPPKDVESALNEIGEQLRHLLYHIKDAGYFDYLL